MSLPSYNFSFSKKIIQTSDDPRTGLHITKCCGNCKYYWYEHAKERRGYCKLPHTKGKDYGVDKENATTSWFKTHITAVCDFHRIRSVFYSITRVGDWIGFSFDANGNKE